MEIVEKSTKEFCSTKKFVDHGPVLRAGPVCEPTKNGEHFMIRCFFYPQKRRCSLKQRISSFGYESYEDALKDRDLFRFAVDLDGAAHWQSPAQLRLAGGAVSLEQKDYVRLFHENVVTFSAKTTSRSDESLGAVQMVEHKLANKRLKKAREPKLSRFAFSEIFNRSTFSDCDIERFKRKIWRIRDPLIDSPQMAPKFLQTRKEMLAVRLANNREINSNLTKNIMESTSHLLIVRDGEHHTTRSPDSVTAEDFSAKQLQRVFKQAFAMTLLFQKLCQKDTEEIGLIETVQSGAGDHSAAYKEAKQSFIEELEHIEKNVLIIEGFEGKPKGWKQILAERGHNTTKMVNSKKPGEMIKLRKNGKAPPDPENCGDLRLDKHFDFTSELSVIEELFHSDGHIHFRTVVCMPNTAGQGIEYCNGKSKYHFRHENERNKQLNFREKVVASFSSSVLPLLRIAKFRRRAYTYMEMYRYLYAGKPTDLPSFRELESRMAETKTTHRNIFELERPYLLKAIEEDKAQRREGGN